MPTIAKSNTQKWRKQLENAPILGRIHFLRMMRQPLPKLTEKEGMNRRLGLTGQKSSWIILLHVVISYMENHIVEAFLSGTPLMQSHQRCHVLRHSISVFPRFFHLQLSLESSASGTERTEETVPGQISASSIYIDIEVANQSAGRLVFHLTNPTPLPLHAENFVQLIKGSRRGIDPKAHYVGCQFDYSPASVEEGGMAGLYRWGHQLKGRGRNAVGRADQPLSDPVNQLQCTHSCFGGQYYGEEYREIEGDPGVILTVPVVGPGYGSSKFSIVRVGESPMEWKERLLINSGIIGRMDPSSLDTLHAMARQRMGPPTVVACGVLEKD